MEPVGYDQLAVIASCLPNNRASAAGFPKTVLDAWKTRSREGSDTGTNLRAIERRQRYGRVVRAHAPGAPCSWRPSLESRMPSVLIRAAK
jgi:hypothetical protein